MLFNSFEFIFLFLPIVLTIYFLLKKKNFFVAGKIFLILSSLFYYAYWKPIYLVLILSSIGLNYLIGNILSSLVVKKRKRIYLVLGVLYNVILLGYFKYTNFVFENINVLLGREVNYYNIVLPLAISFFTFQQIAYLVDNYKGLVKEKNIINYILFVSFFPQLIAGPIVHHKEMMWQFDDKSKFKFNKRNFSLGIFIFSIGLFRKVIIADSFAVIANFGHMYTQDLNFFQSWFTAIAYTFQLYFDFSGYTDMAIGIGWMFNIQLPLNFNSPYLAITIQDFWRRWHMTLSRFLRDYIYIPLGGNRKGYNRIQINLFLTFLIGGFWHGAGWNFIIWGALNGIGLVVYNWWRKLGRQIPNSLAWIITFVFTIFCWVFFRAETFNDAINIFKGLFGLNGFGDIHFDYGVKRMIHGVLGGFPMLIKGPLLIVLAFLLIFFIPNSNIQAEKFVPNIKNLVIAIILSIIGIIGLTAASDFIYYQF